MYLMQEIVPLTQLPWFREAEDVSKQQTGTWKTESKLYVVATRMVMTAWDTEAGGTFSMEIVDPTRRPQFSTSQTHAE